MSSKIIIIFLVTCWLFVGYIYFFHNKTSKNTKLNSKKSKLVDKLYNILIKVPVIKKELIEIKSRLYDNNLWEDNILKYKAVIYYLLSWISAIFSFIFVCIYFNNNKYVVFILSFFCYYVKVLVLEILIGDDTSLLSGLVEFNKDLQQNFLMYDDVYRALEESINDSTNYLVVAHATRIQKAMEDPIDMEIFSEECSNDYLKLIALNCSLTDEFGDPLTKEGNSSFIENLGFTNDVIKSELFKRKELRYWLKWKALGCLVPLLAVTPYEIWANLNLPITDMFYKSSKGFLTKIGITIATVICMYLISILSKYQTTDKLKRSYWEEKLLKINFINKFISMFLPKNGSKKHYYYKDLIIRSNVYTKIEWIYLKRFILSISTFIIMISLTISVHKINYYNILNNTHKNFIKNVIVINNEQVDSTDIEKDAIKAIEDKKINNDPDSIKIFLQGKGITKDNQIKVFTEKILDKTIALNSEFIKIYEIILALIIAFIASLIPEANLAIKRNLAKFDMQSEVIMFETVILILMNYEKGTPDLILDYLSKYSTIFKNPIDRAINKLQKSNNEALNELIEEVNYKPFNNIIKCLIKSEDVDVSQAFSNLSNDRKYYSKEREEEDKKTIYQRVSTSRGLSFIPILLVVILYISTPMMIVSSYEMDNFNKEMSMPLEN